MSALDKALKGKISGVKKAVISKTSDVLSAPKRAYNGLKAMRANSDADVLRTERKFKGAADFDYKSGPTDAFKARTAADGVRMRRK